jgi:hypothetical protein
MRRYSMDRLQDEEIIERLMAVRESVDGRPKCFLPFRSEDPTRYRMTFSEFKWPWYLIGTCSTTMQWHPYLHKVGVTCGRWEPNRLRQRG